MNKFILLMHLFPVVSIKYNSSTKLLWNFIILKGVIGAEKGTLTFMVGAELKNFQTIEPILSKMGKNIVHVGLNGSGLAAKICNNLLAAIR